LGPEGVKGKSDQEGGESPSAPNNTSLDCEDRGAEKMTAWRRGKHVRTCSTEGRKKTPVNGRRHT